MIIYSQLEKKPGIYCIENVFNHKKYIGQAISVRQRSFTWRNNLRNGLSGNEHLQRSYNKYGKYAFVFYPICYCNLEESTIKEQYYMDFFDTLNPKFGYNIKLANSHAPLSQETRDKLKLAWKTRKPDSEETKRRKSEGLKGRECSIETRNKISNGNRNKIYSDARKNKLSLSVKRTPVFQYDINMNLVSSYDSMTDAYKQNNWKRNSITQCIKNPQYTFKGYYWRTS